MIQFKYYLKIFILALINVLLSHKNKKYSRNKTIDNFQYYCCFCAIGKKENLYSRELIAYYISLGVEKFVFGDNNVPGKEKLADVLQDYIHRDIIDIIEIFGSTIDQAEFYEVMYEKYKNKCEWLTFFDFDEYLVLYSKNGKKIKLKEFLTNPIFKRCEAIQFNWLIYGDNNLVYYDNRTSIERFTKPNYNSNDNRFVKSIIRGKLNKTVFISGQNYHQPSIEIKLCNSLGEKANFPSFLSSPIYKNAYLMHFNTRTSEEYVEKIKRGYPGKLYKSISNRINKFFQQNEFREEKLNVFKKKFNKTLLKLHIEKYYLKRITNKNINLKVIPF